MQGKQKRARLLRIQIPAPLPRNGEVIPNHMQTRHNLVVLPSAAALLVHLFPSPLDWYPPRSYYSAILSPFP